MFYLSPFFVSFSLISRLQRELYDRVLPMLEHMAEHHMRNIRAGNEIMRERPVLYSPNEAQKNAEDVLHVLECISRLNRAPSFSPSIIPI